MLQCRAPYPGQCDHLSSPCLRSFFSNASNLMVGWSARSSAMKPSMTSSTCSRRLSNSQMSICKVCFLLARFSRLVTPFLIGSVPGQGWADANQPSICKLGMWIGRSMIVLFHHRCPLRQLMIAQHIIGEAVDHHALAAGIGCRHLLAAV